MKISKLLISSFVISASIVTIGFSGHAVEPKSTPTVPSSSGASTPTAQTSPRGDIPASPSGTPTTAPEPTPTTPSSTSPSPEPTGSGSMPSSAQSASARSSSVLAVCGHNSAAFVFSGAEQVPVGCHVSTINAPPGAVLLMK
jgi:hypothetical protein